MTYFTKTPGCGGGQPFQLFIASNYAVPGNKLRNSLVSGDWTKLKSMRVRSFPAFGLLAAIVIGACAFAAPPASAQAVLREIHASGSAHYTEEQILALSGLMPGDPVTRDEVQAIANYLAQLGIFSRVNWTTREADTSLEFEVQDAPVVPVWFDNFPWFSEKELLDSVELAVPLFNGLAPQSGSLLDDISSALTLLLKTNNISGTMEHTLLAKPGSDDQVMQFHVTGPTLTIDSIAYTDPLAQNSPKLDDRKPDIVGKPFSRFAIEMFISEQVRPIYLQNGHLRVQFAAPEPRFTGDPNEPLPSHVAVTVPIEAGPAYKLGQVTWTGNTVINAAPLDSLITIKRGDVVDGLALTAVWQRVEREYALRGYVDAQIDPQPQYSDADSTVAFRVAINEGPQYHMGKLVITGLSLDAERSLRAAWKLQPTAVFDGAWVEDMLVKLEKPTSEIFGRLPVHYSEVGHLIVPGEVPDTMDVLIDFQR
jgi:Surface antigen variable number repeat